MITGIVAQCLTEFPTPQDLSRSKLPVWTLLWCEMVTALGVGVHRLFCLFFFSKSVLIKSYLIWCRLVTGRQISSTTGLWRQWIQLGTDLKWKTGELRYTEHKDELQLIPSWSALIFFSQKRRFERSCNYTSLSIPLLTKTHHTYWWLESFSAAETWSTCVDLHFKPAARRLPWSKTPPKKSVAVLQATYSTNNSTDYTTENNPLMI